MLSTSDGCRIAIHTLRKQRSAAGEQRLKPRHPITLCMMLSASASLFELLWIGTIPGGRVPLAMGGFLGGPKIQFYHLKKGEESRERPSSTDSFYSFAQKSYRKLTSRIRRPSFSGAYPNCELFPTFAFSSAALRSGALEVWLKFIGAKNKPQRWLSPSCVGINLQVLARASLCPRKVTQAILPG